MSVHYIPTEKQLADLGIKLLNKQRHQFLIKLIKTNYRRCESRATT